MNSGTLSAAQDLFRLVASPLGGERVGTAIVRAAEFFGISVRMGKRLFWREPDVSPEVAERLLANEEATLRARLVQIEAQLRAAELERQRVAWHLTRLGECLCEAAQKAGDCDAGTDDGLLLGAHCAALPSASPQHHPRGPASRGSRTGLPSGSPTGRDASPADFRTCSVGSW